MSAKSGQDYEEPMAVSEVLQGHLELWHYALGYVKSTALLCAIELGIPDAIVRCGGAATLDDLVAATKLPLSNLPFLRRLMRALTASHIFVVRHGHLEGQGEGTVDSIPLYELTAASRLLVTGMEGTPNFSLLPAIKSLIIPETMSVILGMHNWIKHESTTATSTFRMVRGNDLWEFLEANPPILAQFYDAMDADTRVIMQGVLSECPFIFQGLTSLIDVGGGRGRAAAAIAAAFPNIKCTVMDLPHVIAEAPKHVNGLCFVAGGMFEHIPPADAILLKSVLHDWDDDSCINILRQCKKAIAHTDCNTKVIIIDIVIGSRPHDVVCKEAQVWSDIYFMNVLHGGAEREEHEWRRIFTQAGFSDYKITPIHGIRSIIEVYP